ncbi:MAG TPA: hypothetical protein EYN67_16150 [Flavobacteriales bacterium]|nr:hypothetical protein [Flavobacteriales bacterium]
MMITTSETAEIKALVFGFDSQGLCDFLGAEWLVIEHSSTQGGTHEFILQRHVDELSLRCNRLAT